MLQKGAENSNTVTMVFHGVDLMRVPNQIEVITRCEKCLMYLYVRLIMCLY